MNIQLLCIFAQRFNKKLVASSRDGLDGKGWVAGDIAPTGKFLYPLGDTTFEELVEVYTEQVQALEEAGIICGYHTMIDWDKTDRESVNALIEVKITPQRDRGFDKIAEKIYNYPEVQSVYLMSGGFDLALIIEGRTMKEVAYFVARKLAPVEFVTSTATHFVLKTYKDKGVVYADDRKDMRDSSCI